MSWHGLLGPLQRLRAPAALNDWFAELFRVARAYPSSWPCLGAFGGDTRRAFLAGY